MHNPKRYNIPQQTLHEAEKCIKRHACLAQHDYQLCGIKISIERHARMVCGMQNDCPYSSRIGSQFVCTCPVRHAIYLKYGK